jgi:hypothetical protein
MPRFPPQGPPRRVPLLQRYYQGITTSCRPSRLTSFPSLGNTTGAFGCIRISHRHRMLSGGPGVGHPVSPSGFSSVETTGSLKFLENPNVRLHMFFDSGRTACTRPFRRGSMAPAMATAKAPTRIVLSKLNSMAFGLAVYASQCWLPRPHARLASSRWSDATGRAFDPQDSDERFQSCFLTSSSSSPKLCLTQCHQTSNPGAS